MSADKRTVHTDALDTLGMIIDETAARDAIHLAVEPCIASERLFPGQHVRLQNGAAVKSSFDDGVGIVDPFLREAVFPGERFWLVVYPRTIKSLRHVWEHPAFPSQKIIDDGTLEESRAYIENFADTIGSTYQHVVDELSRDDGSYNFGTGDSGSIPNDIWRHIEIVTGKKMLTRGDYFSCSC